eukprot:s540_g5.t1
MQYSGQGRMSQGLDSQVDSPPLSDAVDGFTWPSLPCPWLHSCVSKSWFLTPWAALQNATFLAFEIVGENFSAGLDLATALPRKPDRFTEGGILLPSSSRHVPPKLHFPRFVRFADTIEIAICESPAEPLRSFFCTASEFSCWDTKPWSLRVGSDVDCTDFRAVASANQPLNRPDSATSRPFVTVACSVSSPVSPGDFSSPLSCPHPCEQMSAGVCSDGPSQLTLAQSSFDAVSLIDQWFASSSDCILAPADGSERHGGSCSAADASASAPSSSTDGPSAMLPVVPSFAREIVALQSAALRSDAPCDLSGPWVRVWYIHMELHVRSFLARFVQLRGPPHTWRDQINQLWQDVLIPQVEASVDVVTPSPPRGLVDEGIMCDLILAQGIGGTLVPGLVTVRPLDPRSGPRQYSGAVPFPAAVDRHMILAGLDLVQLCSRRDCQVRHGRTVFSRTALHQMLPGYGFLVDVGHPLSIAAPLYHSVGTSLPAGNDEFDPSASIPDAHLSLPASCPIQYGDPLSEVAVSISADWCVESVGRSCPLHSERGFSHPIDSEPPQFGEVIHGVGPQSSSDSLQGHVHSESHNSSVALRAEAPKVPVLHDHTSSFESFCGPSEVVWSEPCFDCPSCPIAPCGGDPLSFEAGLISTKFDVGFPFAGHCISGVSVPPVVHHKLTDPTENDGQLPDRTPAALQPVTPNAVPVQPIVLPAFIHDMFLDLPEEFLDADIFQRGFLIRTWYIHHQTIRRSRVSRCIHLRGPPTVWQAQILTVWFDVLIPWEAAEIDLVKPRPPRTIHEGRLAFDIILSQGLEVDRFAGLITVNPSVRRPVVPRFAMAVSFPAETHGQMIVEILAFQQVCQNFQCFIAHRWNQLPMSPLPAHVMQPGDSFVVGVFTRIPDSEPLASAPASSHHLPASAVQDPQDMDWEPSDSAVPREGLAPSPAPSSSSGSSQSATDAFRRRLHLYRRGHVVVTVVVPWPLPPDLLSLIAPALEMQPWELVAIYPVQVKLEDETEEEISFVVRHIDDLAFAETEQLLLFDVVVHQHSQPGVGALPVFRDRQVVRVPADLSRSQVLAAAHLSDYCQLVMNRCLIKINARLWPLQDTGVRRVIHGVYVQVIVPPPRSTDVHVLRAIEIVEDFGWTTDGDRFVDHYPNWGLSSSDPSTSFVDDAAIDQTIRHALHSTSKVVGSASLVDFPAVHPVEHANDDQVQDPPDFANQVGVLPMLQVPVQAPLPPLQDLTEFLVAFGATFDRVAEEEFDNQGPVLQVITWYIHHGQYTECRRHHTVELEADPTTWPASLCAPWADTIRLHEPLAFREVLPGPPRHSHQRHIAHVILEQGLWHDKYASLFSILVQGTHHDGMIQKAYSTPKFVSAEDLLTITGLRDRCHVYRCTAWSGIMQFEPVLREQTFSGISVKLHIHGPTVRHRLVDFGDQPFWHPEPSGAASSSAGPIVENSQMSNKGQFDLLAEPEIHPHFDGLFCPDLLTAWQVFLAQAQGPPYLFRVQTWFCDHIRLARSNEGRVVQLPVEANSWKDLLAAAWSDWILPGIAVQYYVVYPEPPSAAADLVAHVILAQNQLPGFISVLISSTIPDEDPYYPSHRVVKLPRIVDHWMLLHEGGLMLHCPPFAENRHCQSWCGHHRILPSEMRPSSSGEGFYVVAETSEQNLEAAYHSTSHHLDRLFGALGDAIQTVVQLVCSVINAPGLDTLAHDDRDLLSQECISSDRTVGSDVASPNGMVGVVDSKLDLSGGSPSLISLADCLPPEAPDLDSVDDRDFGYKLRRACQLVPPRPASQHGVCARLPVVTSQSGSLLSAVPISLDACLGTTHSFDPNRQFVPEGLCWSADWPSIIASTPVDFASLPVGLPMTAASLHALSCPELYCEPWLADSCVMYVDGSADGLRAAWSVVCIQYTSAGFPIFHGCLAGPVTLNTAAPGWIGATSPDNVAAELTAVLAAMIATLGVDSDRQVVIRPDLQLSVRLAEGLWTCRMSLHRVPVSTAPAVSPVACEIAFVCATANVLALGAAQVGEIPQSVSERVLRLDRQWHQSRIAVVGLQETRRPSGRYVTEHYVCFSSGAQVCNRALHFGCELWIHQQLPLVPNASLLFRDFRVAVVVSDPRRLVVSLTHQHLALSFVVLHVPCVTASTPLVEVEAWWIQTEKLLKHANLASLTWCMIDLNAPLALCETVWFSTAGAEPTNPQGLLAERMLQAFQWHVPSTLSWCHVGPHATWTHPRGHRARRDFVCCSSAAFQLVECTWVDTHFDGGFAHDDHFPVLLQCRGWLETSAGGGAIPWDPLAFVDPIKCKQFRAAVQPLPIPTWDTHVDSHAQIFETQLLALARQHFTKTRKERVRPRLTESTLNLIQFKRSCLDYGRSRDLMQDREFRQVLQLVEKDVRIAVRQDQKAFYADLVNQLAAAGQLHDAKSIDC